MGLLATTEIEASPGVSETVAGFHSHHNASPQTNCNNFGVEVKEGLWMCRGRKETGVCVCVCVCVKSTKSMFYFMSVHTEVISNTHTHVCVCVCV